jgi:hypothetical protein
LDRTKIWKYLDLLEDAKSIVRIYFDRSIASGSIKVGSTESQSIELLAVQIIDRSKCL